MERKSKKQKFLDKYQNSDWSKCSGRSEAWQYFQTATGDNGEKLVRCVKCLNIYEHNNSSSTTHLRRHLISVHKIELSDYHSTQELPKPSMTSGQENSPGTKSQVSDSKRPKMLREFQGSEWVRCSNMSSEVWKHFEVKTNSNGKRWVRCDKCRKISEWKDANTNNLRFHLMNKHQINLSEKGTAGIPDATSLLSDFARSVFDESSKKESGTMARTDQDKAIEADVEYQYQADEVPDLQTIMKISSVYSEAREADQMRNKKEFKCSYCPNRFHSALLLKQHHCLKTLTGRSPSLTKKRYDMLRESQNSEWVLCPNMNSDVWEYFELKINEDGSKLVRCIKCLRVNNQNDTKTYNMSNHLHKVHQIDTSEKSGTTVPSNMQRSITVSSSMSHGSYAEELSKTAADLTAKSHKFTPKNQPKNNLPPSKKNLDAWNYFKVRPGKNGKEVVRCEICAKASPLSNVSTSNLWGHLFKAHSDRFSQNNGSLVPEPTAKSTIEWQSSESIKPSSMTLSGDPKVLEYFELRLCKSGKKLARCDMCAKIFEFQASSTSELRRHLLDAHQINLSEMGAPVESSSGASAGSNKSDVADSKQQGEDKPLGNEQKDGKSVDDDASNDEQSVDDTLKDGKTADSGNTAEDKLDNGDPKYGKLLNEEENKGKVEGEDQGKPTKSWLKSAQSMCKMYNKTFRVAEMAEKLEEGGGRVSDQ